MSIGDPRGSFVRPSTHKVSTLAAARKWFDGVVESDLPITVDAMTTDNGRVAVRIYDRNFKLIQKRG